MLSQVPTRDILAAGTPVVAGLVVAGLAVRLSRARGGTPRETTGYTDLRRPYFWSCVVFALGAVVCGVVRARAGGPVEGVTDTITVTTFAFSLPWTVFALNYVGRGHLLTGRGRYVGGVYFGALVLNELLDAAAVRSVLGPYPDLSVVSALIVLGVVVVVFTTGGLVLLSTYRHSTLTLADGVVAVFPILGLFSAVQVIPSLRPSPSLDVVVSGAWLASAVALVLATTRYDVLAVRPGTGTAGERAAVREMDEATVTVERDGTLARANTAAVDLFGERLDEDPFVDVVGTELAALTERETIECWTRDGRKQFDPRVTELVNDYNEVFGYTVVLIDITDREIRRQRIEVLNRILRHNMRNSLDVIRANAERVTDGDHAASILETTDTLERLSADARRIENLLGQSGDERRTADLVTVVASVAESVGDDHLAASVSVDLPELSVAVDAELCRFALRNVVENAVVHNDGAEPRVEVRGAETETGVRLVVADDGPGIPESERSVIERRSESQQSHASSLGLWGANWAVQQLGGELSFRESDLGGTAVVIELAAG